MWEAIQESNTVWELSYTVASPVNRRREFSKKPMMRYPTNFVEIPMKVKRIRSLRRNGGKFWCRTSFTGKKLWLSDTRDKALTPLFPKSGCWVMKICYSIEQWSGMFLSKRIQLTHTHQRIQLTHSTHTREFNWHTNMTFPACWIVILSRHEWFRLFTKWCYLVKK